MTPEEVGLRPRRSGDCRRGGAGFRGSGSVSVSGSGTALSIPSNETEDGERLQSHLPLIKAGIKVHY